MAFNPRAFVDAAYEINRCRKESCYRTAVGRAYYAVYGCLIVNLCSAKNCTRQQLFRNRGRHGDLIKCMQVYQPFRKMASSYCWLHGKRVDSDYKYGRTVDRTTAVGAIQTAEKMISDLTAMRKQDFVRFPLIPSP